MAITLKQIGEYLEKLDVKFGMEEAESIIYYGAKNDADQVFKYVVRLRENGELFQMYCSPPIDNETLKNHPNKALLMLYVLEENSGTKIGSWEYDDRNGLIFAAEIPLEDGTLTFEQFKRIFVAVMGSYVSKELPNLLYVLENGEFPNESSETIPAELMAEFREFLKAKKKTTGTPDSI